MRKSNEGEPPISAKDAVSRGFWMVKLPSMVFMFGPWIAFVVLVDREHSVGSEGFKLFLPTFLGGFVLGWLAWSVLVPYWRLWAYQRVSDIDELKLQAVASRLIWPEGDLFEKTEIVSRNMRERIRALEQR